MMKSIKIETKIVKIVVVVMKETTISMSSSDTGRELKLLNSSKAFFMSFEIESENTRAYKMP